MVGASAPTTNAYWAWRETMDDFTLNNNAEFFLNKVNLEIDGETKKRCINALKLAMIFGVEHGEKKAKKNIREALGL